MKPLLSFVAVVLIITGGCATHPSVGAQCRSLDTPLSPANRARAEAALQSFFPVGYRAVHRGVITHRRRQFTCDALLAVAPDRTAHLALVSALGAVTELRVDPQGTCAVLKVTPLFRERWARDHVAHDLRWLCLPPPQITDAARSDDGRILLRALGDDRQTHATYVMSATGDRWEELRLHHPKHGGWIASIQPPRHRSTAGPTVPSMFDVEASRYHLNLRVLEATPLADARGIETGGAR